MLVAVFRVILNVWRDDNDRLMKYFAFMQVKHGEHCAVIIKYNILYFIIRCFMAVLKTDLFPSP
jgi:hypothetical protein